MNKTFFLLPLLLFVGCDGSNEKTKQQTKLENTTDSLEIVGFIENEIMEQNESDCIFDQETQNSDFLDSIPAFKNHIWSDSTKTALVFRNNDTIRIHRGGCDHFDFTVSIIVKNDSTPLTNSNYWYKKIRAETEFLEAEFDNSLFDSLYYSKSYELDSTENHHYHLFDQELYCSMIFLIEKNNDGAIEIQLGYYYC